MLLLAAGLIVLFYVALCVLLYFVQDKAIFHPTADLVVNPDETDLNLEDVYITTGNGEKINAWFMPAPTGSELGHRFVLFFHGNAGNMSHRVSTLETFQAVGVNVLMIDYRGFGLSEGKPTEENLYDDARSAYQWLLDNKSAVDTNIFLFGRSMGGAVAVDLASKVKCGGLIVESSFTSMAAIGQARFPFIPVKLLLRYRFDSLSKIDKVNCPVLITHSQTDGLIPYRMGKDLYARALEPKWFYEIEGDHNQLIYLESRNYRAVIREFLRGLVKSQESAK